MQEQERVLVEKLVSENPRFRKLYEEHQFFEKELVELEDRPHLTPEDELEQKKIKKLKLAGKEEMELILQQHRD
ncbi:MAG: DUF465 domain-containing protein [Desulfuromonas sp.]|nr:MAG: DUF465 domain-containing protein [Desulfuromonas sp.]